MVQFINQMLTTNSHTWMAQVSPPPQPLTWEFLSGSQFFVALIAGVVMAFAFQFLLTNFTIAADMSAGANPFEGDTKSLGQKIRSIESKVGGWTLVTVNMALFVACFLAVKLTLVHSVRLGAIVGVVIWSAYFLLLLWAGSRTVGSVFSAIGSTASTGLQGIVGTVATALSGTAVNAQIVNTVEASVEAVTQELKSELASGLAPDRLRESVQNYINQLQIPQPDVTGTLSQASDLLSNISQQSGDNLALPNLAQAAAPDSLTSGLVSIAQAAAPEDLKAGKLQHLIQQLIKTGSNQSKSSGKNLRNQVVQQAVQTLIPAVAQRVDLSDVDVEAIAKQLNSLGQKVSQQAGQAASALTQSQPFSTIRTDVENYLLNSPSWYLRSDSLDSGFREVLRDPDANPGLVRQQLEQLNRGYFIQVLNRREGLESNRVNDIADQLELIRREVLSQVREAEAQTRSQELRQQVEAYLSAAPKDALTPNQIGKDFPGLLADPDASYETLGNRLIQFDRGMLKQMLLTGRQDLNEDELEPILDALEQSRDRFLNQSQAQWQQLQEQASQFQGQVESYLRETNLAELTPDQIQQNLQRLANLPETGYLVVQSGLGQLDRSSLEKLLAQRQDLSQEQVHQLIDRFESARDRIVHAPQELAGQAKDQYDRLMSQIAEYLRNTDLEELNPEGIRQDLFTLITAPQVGASAVQQRLAQVDRDTLVQLLSQRQDLSEDQVNQVIDQVQETLRSAVQVPQRFATRTRDRIQDFPNTLADYLRNTDREELNPDGIRRDLQLLVQQPQMGLAHWRDRLSQFDRDTLVSLLSQRQDISEEEANRIADQIASVRDQLMQQAQQAQEQVQSTIDSLFERLRRSLNALDRPELNYDSIKHDLRTLFNDPEAGFEALRDRLSQFDRDTITAILSSRSDISEAQANRIIDQIEAARDSVLHQAQRLQEEAEKRISALKHEAQEQVESVQKTVATAAWWLFGTAVTSVATAAIAGILASGGLDILS